MLDVHAEPRLLQVGGSHRSLTGRIRATRRRCPYLPGPELPHPVRADRAVRRRNVRVLRTQRLPAHDLASAAGITVPDLWRGWSTPAAQPGLCGTSAPAAAREEEGRPQADGAEDHGSSCPGRGQRLSFGVSLAGPAAALRSRAPRSATPASGRYDGRRGAILLYALAVIRQNSYLSVQADASWRAQSDGMTGAE